MSMLTRLIGRRLAWREHARVEIRILRARKHGTRLGAA